MKVKNLLLNKEKKITTLVVEEEPTNMEMLEYLLKGEPLPEKTKAIQLRCHEDDEYDPYVGAALALAEASFGSKRQFRMWVDKNAKVVKSRDEKKAERKEVVKKAKKVKKNTK